MNFSEMQTRVSVLLDDLSFGYHTQDQVKIYINDAAREVQKYLIQAGQNFYTKCGETTLVVNSCKYYLPSDFLKVNRVSMVISGTAPNENIAVLEPISLNQQDLITANSGDPVGYVLQKNTIKFYPTPATARTLRLDYTYKIVDASLDSEVVDVPTEYHELVVLLAARTGYLRDDRPIVELQVKIDGYTNSMKQDAADRVQQRGRRVILTRAYEDSDGYY